MIRKVVVACGALMIWLLVTAGPAAAHPLGNFTVNTAAALRIGADGVIIDYAIDLAEIPTLQARNDLDANGDGEFSTAEQNAYRDGECATVAQSSRLDVDGAPVALVARGRSISIVEGLAALPTVRLTCELRGDVDLGGGSTNLSFESGYASGRVGWHEVSAQGDRMTLDQSSVPNLSPSDLLTDYPTEEISSPPDVRRADLTVRPGGAALAGRGDSRSTSAVQSTVPGVDRATRSFANLVGSRDLTVRIGLLSVAIAFVLGIFHAVAPGHGKTVMAAYLVGQHGTLKQALGVGASVTLTHTAGVLVLGFILSVSSVAAPENLYPWLGAFSGVMLATIGAALLIRARRLHKRGVANVWHSHAPGALGHVHPEWLAAADHGHGDHGHGDHDHDHDHDHGDHDHGDHDHGDHDHAAAGARVLVASGAAATSMPSPSLGHRTHEHGGHRAEDRGAGNHGDADDHVHPHEPVQPMGWRWIIAMGFAGGMVPSPSALVVLLGAVALGRTWFGVALVSAYGLGMATTLVVAGLILVRARERIEVLVRSERGQRFARILSVLPTITAVIIVGGGVLIATRAIGSM